MPEPTFPPTYKYPLTVGQPPFEKFIKFDAKRMRHVLRNTLDAARDLTLASVVLYLPETALKNTLTVGWNQQDIGVVAGAVLNSTGKNGATATDTTWQGLMNNMQGAAGGAIDTVKSLWKAGGVSAIAQEVAQSAIAKKLDENPGIANPIYAQLGMRANPRTEILFDAAQYRQYQFDFMMVPRNYKEAESIDNIVRFFQFYMLPTYGNKADNDSVIGYPFEFNVGLFNNLTPGNELPATSQIKRLSHIGRCIVKNVTVDYAAGGKVAFVRDDSTIEKLFPVATSLSIELQEVKLLGREDREIRRTDSDAGDADFDKLFPSKRDV